MVFKTYVFESLRPTPELSFAVRHLGTFAGIMVTASHNPAPFNGYKSFMVKTVDKMPPADADALTDFYPCYRRSICYRIG